jgi:hypothetical protein
LGQALGVRMVMITTLTTEMRGKNCGWPKIIVERRVARAEARGPDDCRNSRAGANPTKKRGCRKRFPWLATACRASIRTKPDFPYELVERVAQFGNAILVTLFSSFEQHRPGAAARGESKLLADWLVGQVLANG